MLNQKGPQNPNPGEAQISKRVPAFKTRNALSTVTPPGFDPSTLNTPQLGYPFSLESRSGSVDGGGRDEVGDDEGLQIDDGDC